MKKSEKEIDDLVASWHSGNSLLPLWQYLGMTLKEYRAYLWGYEFYLEESEDGNRSSI